MCPVPTHSAHRECEAQSTNGHERYGHTRPGCVLRHQARRDIRVTCVQPGAVESELFEHITDGNYRQQMEGLKERMTFLKAEDIGESIVYALQAPARVDLAEVFIMPTSQPW